MSLIKKISDKKIKIAIIGLGYVGLELAYQFAQKKCGTIIGYDIDKQRVIQLKEKLDSNNILNTEALKNKSLRFTYDSKELNKANFYIITVGTPVNADNIPDLSHIKQASITVGLQLKKGDIVIYESTVYPGATEDVCVPILEEYSKLTNQKDFTVGYSPERVNIGDDEHTIANTVKIISAQDASTLQIVKAVYEKIINAGVHCAPNIKTAEASKLLENTQRDLNISLMNEFSMILHKLGVNTRDVLKAAATKWNFIPVVPGLVGGHCISVDPYYFTYLAKKLNFNERLINVARQINNDMSGFIADELVKQLIKLNIRVKKAKVAIFGFTFKEDCTDVRNTRVYELIKALQAYDMQIYVSDPVADEALVKSVYDVDFTNKKDIVDMNVLIFTVSHQQYLSLSIPEIMQHLKQPGLIMDLKSIWQPSDFAEYQINYWSL